MELNKTILTYILCANLFILPALYKELKSFFQEPLDANISSQFVNPSGLRVRTADDDRDGKKEVYLSHVEILPKREIPLTLENYGIMCYILRDRNQDKSKKNPLEKELDQEF